MFPEFIVLNSGSFATDMSDFLDLLVFCHVIWEKFSLCNLFSTKMLYNYQKVIPVTFEAVSRLHANYLKSQLYAVNY